MINEKYARWVTVEELGNNEYRIKFSYYIDTKIAFDNDEQKKQFSEDINCYLRCLYDSYNYPDNLPYEIVEEWERNRESATEYILETIKAYRVEE